ncbi:hypothetical protein DRO54_10080 [Candidatus Bathyarchaeota archaeon]|nr:MAG: hypothetical protein DRO54_10080 [Candidatus Bathyarchaeota archaeon]
MKKFLIVIIVFLFCIGCKCLHKDYIAVKKEHLITLKRGIHYYVDHSAPDSEKTKKVGELIKKLIDNITKIMQN